MAKNKKKPAGPTGPTRRQRAGAFLRDYTEGFDLESTRRLIERDAARALRVLSRDEADAPVAPDKGVSRVLHQARLIFLGLSFALSPARRLVFAGALVATLLGVLGTTVRWDVGVGPLRINSSTLYFLAAVAGLILLLALELVDRIRMRDELEVARELQRDLLPRRPPEISGFAVACSYRTAVEIGGDYHAFLPLADGRIAIAVGDASGHGMGAGLLMAIADATLRTAVDLDPEPASVAAVLNRRLCSTGDRRAFLSLFYAVLDTASGRLRWIVAGHPFPLLGRAAGAIEELGTGGLPLGLRPELVSVAQECELAPGDRLLVITDGLPEALGTGGESFGFERVREALAEPASAHAVHARLLRRFEEHLGEETLLDDMTIVVLERLPPLPPRTPPAGS